ncbi:4864_t:CDS:2 [Ambispora leptoticha]|uniref:4864_t:CDS:1 n=1 Tax=Ambispora leptoticha TaxID=144679 RepID=A0A9N8YZL7_9GLOM|nr:4864_t:CDS:2 [Ambispora leptoticha]
MDAFIAEYAKPNKPVIITDVVTKWPAYKKWTMDYLVEKWGDVVFRAEAIDIKLREYARYAANSNMDESPLYLFDKNFAEKCYGIENDYSVPEYFAEDFFKVLDKNRPDYRWLIIGPSRAGSTFHKDPNSTSAWNAVITGSKKWIMYPPNILPPGVFTSDDEAEVTSPISLMEWHLNFYKEAQRSHPRPLEGVCQAGEIIFVPNGWWHMVVNLEDSIAITQNFVGTHNLLNVLCFLRDKPDQISGFGNSFENCRDIYKTFREAFRERYQGVLEKIELENERKFVNKNNPIKSTWDKIKNNENGNENSEVKKFSFNFEFEDSNDDSNNDVDKRR